MATKYILKHRRGTSTDWQTWLSDGDNCLYDGEIAIEDCANGQKRFLIGDGTHHSYANMPKVCLPGYVTEQYDLITLSSDNWTSASANLYTQVPTFSAGTNIDTTTKIDLLLTPQQLAALQIENISFVAENNNGTIIVYAIGCQPTANYTVNVVITGVAAV